MNITTCGSYKPVTALCIIKTKIFAGCGLDVQVFDKNSGNLVQSLPTLLGSTVHGFSPGPVLHGKKILCAFGAKHARMLYCDSQITESCLTYATLEQQFEDWIWDATWLEDEAGGAVALATAHNVILLWCWKTGEILHRVTCFEKCILYCARLIGSSWSDLILASGTVFNQVVIWSPCYADSADCSGDSSQQVLQRLTGHEGVIFSVCYHPERERICSASDDRSIILYRVHFPATVPHKKLLTVKDWQLAIIEPVQRLFGHSGRVWDVTLLSDVFVSVGEDSHCIVWSYEGKIIHKHKGHKGRSIWSLAVSEDESFVVTGGGDSSIRQWKLEEKLNVTLFQQVLKIPQDTKDFVKKVALWDFDTVVVITNKGCLFLYKISSSQWQKLLHDSDLSGYCTIAMAENRLLLALAGIHGHVLVLHRKSRHSLDKNAFSETKAQLLTGKVCGLTWINNDHMLTTGLDGICVLAKVCHSPEGILTVTSVTRLLLPPCKNRWVVAGLLLSSSVTMSSSCTYNDTPTMNPYLRNQSTREVTSHLVSGDRCGSVHLYLLDADGLGGKKPTPPVQTFSNIHGSAGVTWICHQREIILTSGRDGLLHRWILKDGQLQFLSSTRVLKGFDWIDRLWIESDVLFVLGFCSSKFVIWSEGQGEKLLEVECGGGHRSWDCLQQVRGQTQCYHFVFVKAGDIVLVSGKQTSGQNILKPPLHGAKVWDVKHLASFLNSQGCSCHLVCSGSEDTTLSLGVLHCASKEGGLQWTSHHSLHAHLSSVRTLAVVSTENYCIVFSAGGRAQIQIWKVDVSHSCDFTCETITSGTKTNKNTQKLTHNSISDTPVGIEHERLAFETSETHTDFDCCIADPESNQSALKCIPVTSEGIQILDVGSEMKDLASDRTRTDVALEDTDVTSERSQTAEDGSTAKAPQAAFEHLAGCFLGESRHKRPHKPWKTRQLKLDPETRVMCLSAMAMRHIDPSFPLHWHLLAVAGSDGLLRLFMFDESKVRVVLLAQSSYNSGCLLKVFLHLHRDPYELHTVPLLLSAATDGCVAAWDLRPVLQLAFSWVVKEKGDRVGQHEESPKKHDYIYCKDENEKVGSDDDGKGVERSDAETDDSLEIEDEKKMFKLITARQQTFTTSTVPAYTDAWVPMQTIKAHQSGINSIHMKTLIDGTLILATGGDDNALTVHRLKATVPGDVESGSGDATESLNKGTFLLKVESAIEKTDAHAAQITGVWVLSDELFLTASVDQRVNLWHLNRDKQLELECSKYVDIADISNMDIWQHLDKVYIGLCGEGMALLSLQLPAPAVDHYRGPGVSDLGSPAKST